MSAWARPGAKCVCIDDADLGNRDGLQKGQTYTVRSVAVMTDFTGRTGLAVRLEEIVRRTCPFSGVADLGFHVRRFRPLIPHSQEQDVAKFRHLLVPSPIDAGLVPAGVELDT